MNTTTIQTVSLDNDLFTKVNRFKSAGHYQNNSEVLAELIRAGLQYFAEQSEDEYLLALALERKKNDNGVRWSEEDIMRKYGITTDE